MVQRVAKDACGGAAAEALGGGREAREAAQRGASLGTLGHHLAGGHCVRACVYVRDGTQGQGRGKGERSRVQSSGTATRT